jgi:hypothetical protein
VKQVVPNSGVFVLPSMMKPARLMRATVSQSTSGTRSLNAALPSVVTTPAVSFRSLIEIGTPWNGGRPSGSLAPLTFDSASRACSSAVSSVVVRYAPSFGFSSSMRRA